MVRADAVRQMLGLADRTRVIDLFEQLARVERFGDDLAHTEAVERAMELMKGIGAKRVIKLNVSAPFHCALMKPAQQRLEIDLQQLAFAEPRVPVVTNVDALVRTSASELRDALVRQVSAPVRWLESMELLIQQGVTTFVEVGPGKVLSGLMRQISREVNCLNVEAAESLKAAREKLTA